MPIHSRRVNPTDVKLLIYGNACKQFVTNVVSSMEKAKETKLFLRMLLDITFDIGNLICCLLYR